MQFICLFLKISKEIIPRKKGKDTISYYVFTIILITENYIALSTCKAPF